MCPGAAGPCAMEGGELGVENMESLTELGDELTLGDIDGGRRGKGGGGGRRGGGRGSRLLAWVPPRAAGGGVMPPRLGLGVLVGARGVGG